MNHFLYSTVDIERGNNRWLPTAIGKVLQFSFSVCPSVLLYCTALIGHNFLSYKLEFVCRSQLCALAIVYVLFFLLNWDFFSHKIKFQVCSNVLFDSKILSSWQEELNHHNKSYLLFHFQRQNIQNVSLYIVCKI